MKFLRAAVRLLGDTATFDVPEIDFFPKLNILISQEQARARQLKADQDRREELKRQAAAAEAQRIRTNCAAIYKATIDKRTGDLTVRETEQINACSALGAYLP
jgi:hypothetical protein